MQIQVDPETNTEIQNDAGTVVTVTDTPEVSVEAAEAADTHKEELDELRKQLEEANRRATEAESRTKTVQVEKATAETQLSAEIASRFQAQEAAVESRMRNAETGLAASKAEFIRAQTEQRFEDAGNLAEAIADYKTELKAAIWDKNHLKSIKEQATSEAEARARAPRVSSDPVEAFVSIIPGDASKRWLRSHPDILQKVATNQSEQKKLFAYAQLAEAEGNTPDTPAYFDFIEEKYGLKQAATTENKTRTSGRTSTAAPASRSVQTQEVGERVVKLDDVVRKLTASDRANARTSFPDKTEKEALELYAHGLVISKKREPGFRPDIKL